MSSKKTLEPLILQAQAGECVAYFADAAHFVMGGVMGSVWSKKRVFVQTPSGRKRLNVLGAINPLNQKLLTVVNEDYINSNSVCELLRKIRKAHPDRSVPVKIVMDTASRHGSIRNAASWLKRKRRRWELKLFS